MTKLKQCPCGKLPARLNILDANQGGKWAIASGDCCAEWLIEFRTGYEALESDACMDLAVEAWNDAPRKR